MRIRMVKPEDAAQLLSIYAPYVEKTPITFEYEVPSEEEFRKRIIHTLEKYPYLATVDEDGQILGYAYAGPFKSRAAYDWAVETSIYVREGLRGHGIGTGLYRALEEILKKQHIINLNACITYPNPQSVAFHEKEGYRRAAYFTKCGYKLGSWHDMIWMEKMLGEHPACPIPVIPLKQLLLQTAGRDFQ